MQDLFEKLIRPSLLSMISAFIATLFILAALPLAVLKHFPIFYQENKNFYPAYSINFQTNPGKKSVVLLGGSRYRELTADSKQITKLLSIKTKQVLVYENIGISLLGYAEGIALINQSHYEEGSVVLIGIDMFSLPRSVASSHGTFEIMRLGFVDYYAVMPLLRSIGVHMDLPSFSLYQNLHLLRAIMEDFTFGVLFSQSWNSVDFKYERPESTGSLSGGKKEEADYGEKISDIYSARNLRKNFQENKRLLLALMQLSKEKGYQVVLIEAPYSPVSESLTQDHLESYESMVQEVSDEAGVAVIRADDATLTNEDFADSTHLNEHGRKTYQPIFINQVASAVSKESA